MGAVRHIPDALTLNREDALAFTGLGNSVLAALERSGSITGKKIGHKGEIRYPRWQLESAVRKMFETTDDNDLANDL
ncbi:hypothetical protein ACSMXM_05745 [Pacificimonas sp. ICDLI1SI03]